jgi:hypothetical protein
MPSASDLAHRKWVERECAGCGQTFRARGWRGQVGRCCSRSCAGKIASRRSGTSKSALCREARRVWIERHGEPPLCEVCGEPGDVHHENRDRTDNSEENQRALCRRHHITLENIRFPRRRRHQVACEGAGRPHRHTSAPPEYEGEIKTLEEQFGLDREIQDLLRKGKKSPEPGATHG